MVHKYCRKLQRCG